MNENNEHNAPEERLDPFLGGGYDPKEEDPTAGALPEDNAPDNESTQPERIKSRELPIKKTDEWRRNVSSVFGHGIGRLSIISALLVVLILVAVGIRTLADTADQATTSNAQVEVPNAPTAPVDINPVSQKEAERRYEQSGKEANQAQASGDSYQPAFIPNIVENGGDQGQTASLDIFETGQNTSQLPVDMPLSRPPVDVDRERQLLEEARQRRQKEYELALKARDDYVKKKQEKVLDQLDKLLKGDALNKLGTNTIVSYPSAKAETPIGSQEGAGGSQSSGSSSASNLRSKPVIRTGNLLYAETISAINTDDGTEVLAVIRGGTWDGSKLIGRAEMRPNNIGVKFTTLAPQDGRGAMSINAVALRTEDASQGVAEDIDHHTFERYMALGASSLLAGLGKAYATTPGTAVIAPSGTTVTTTEEPSSKQVAATVVGELGTAMSQEIQRGFNRPSTYSTPAGQGFAVFFLADVIASN